MRWLQLESTASLREPLTSVAEEPDTLPEQPTADSAAQDQPLEDLAPSEGGDDESSKQQHDWVEQPSGEGWSTVGEQAEQNPDQAADQGGHEEREGGAEGYQEEGDGGPLEVTHLWSLASEIPATCSQVTQLLSSPAGI